MITPQGNVCLIDFNISLDGEETTQLQGLSQYYAAPEQYENAMSIIHGRGTGALRKGIHDHLKKHKSVAEFRPGAYGEGDRGVTIVKLK